MAISLVAARHSGIEAIFVLIRSVFRLRNLGDE